MASKKRKSATVVDSNNSSKKSKEELIAELIVIGVNAPASFSQKQLQALLNSNRQAMPAVNMQPTDDTEVNDIISKNTILELSANVKSLTETVKSQGEILKTVVDLQKNATGSDLSHTGTQNQSSSQIIETHGNNDSGKVSAELHHHVTLNSSCRNDLSLWHKFLDQWNGISFFIDDNIVSASDFDLYTDAASTVGFGGYFKIAGFKRYIVEMKLDTELSLSMAYMELYPIVIAAIIWGNEWSGKRILFHCDNMATVLIIKKGRSKSLEIMRLMRRLTWCSAKYNVIIHATHIAGKYGPFSSTVSDSISGTLSLPAPLRISVELSCVINNLWSKSINSATRDVYTSGYKCFLKFRTSPFEGENIGNVMSNISEDILICFVSYCQSVLGLKYSTIKLYLAGIRHFSIANCSVNPLVDNVGKPLLRLQNILNGIKKTENKSVRQKLPITYSVLHQIYHHLQKSIFDPHLDFTMSTAAVIGFFGFLRCSEFTCKQSFDSALNLTMDDVVFVSDCQVNLRLKASKTDIFVME
ncbi:unnamed protein product [Mytilus coruscus]|uniref:Uncharacterized protein n=1 Tax=Mytilus coruscus TaxID=42192 RepID=A0A6J8C0P8_MYTCO|nr:unnamed protein product [Mytilus coruscus]